MDCGFDRSIDYGLSKPDCWEGDLAADEETLTEWMRRAHVLDVCDAPTVDALTENGWEWRIVAAGRLSGGIAVQIRMYRDEAEEARFPLPLDDVERAAIAGDMREWLTEDGVLDGHDRIVGGHWL